MNMLVTIQYVVLCIFRPNDYFVDMNNGYTPDCPVARTLDIVGEKWSLLILRDMFEKGARRFQDLEMSLEGVAATTLSARIKSLEKRGIIEGQLYQAHPPRYEYSLTAKGRALGPILDALRDWGEQHTRVTSRPSSARPGGRTGSSRPRVKSGKAL